MGQIIDALRERSDVVAEPPELLEPSHYFHFATADRLALVDVFGRARLFVGSAEWVLRAPTQMDFFAIPIRGSSYEPRIGRVVDLPDGSFLALADLARGAHCVLRIPEAVLEPLPEQETGGLTVRDAPTHRIAQSLDQIAVVGYSLAEVLERALESDGALPEAIARWSALEHV
jgi:hypothetical protein